MVYHVILGLIRRRREHDTGSLSDLDLITLDWWNLLSEMCGRRPIIVMFAMILCGSIGSITHMRDLPLFLQPVRPRN